MRTGYEDWNMWQLAIAADLYPDNLELQFELVRRESQANEREQLKLLEKAEKLKRSISDD